MCYKKRTIKNRILESHRTGFDKVHIECQCGNCPQCRRMRSRDWLVRSYFEFLGNNRQAFFVTLDFNDFWLPRYNGKPCFDSEKMQSFLMRLRKAIGKFRYFYSTDYGGFLHRPHYHAVFIPDSYIEPGLFFQKVAKSWKYGSHTKIDLLPSVNGDKLKAISYICDYATKDITFSIKDYEDRIDENKKMPMRCRPRVQASKGFGLQAIDNGIITPEFLLSQKKLLLPVGKGGTDILLPVPRYYEMKLCYDYIWHRDTQKAELIKNKLGVDVDIVRHNGRYVYNIKEFFASRHYSLSQIDLSMFSSSWRDLVYDCLTDFDDFKEYMFLRPFIEFMTEKGYLRDSLSGQSSYRPNWPFYQSVYRRFLDFKKLIDEEKYKIGMEELVYRARKRAVAKLRHNPQLLFYLQRKKYDFSQIYN